MNVRVLQEWLNVRVMGLVLPGIFSFFLWWREIKVLGLQKDRLMVSIGEMHVDLYLTDVDSVPRVGKAKSIFQSTRCCGKRTAYAGEAGCYLIIHVGRG